MLKKTTTIVSLAKNHNVKRRVTTLHWLLAHFNLLPEFNTKRSERDRSEKWFRTDFWATCFNKQNQVCLFIYLFIGLKRLYFNDKSIFLLIFLRKVFFSYNQFYIINTLAVSKIHFPMRCLEKILLFFR